MAKQTAPVHESWLPEANQPNADFPLTHLPYGAFELEGQQHLCVAIGAHLLDLHACAASNLLHPPLVAACQAPSLNPFLSLGHRAWTLLRETLTALLHTDAPSDRRQAAEAAIHSIAGDTVVKPIHIPHYKHIPIAYHGRPSSIIPSGMPVIRPTGQSRPSLTEDQPNFLPTKSLDYELELALYIGQPSLLGTPVPISQADHHLFGVSLLNDWSARDIQSWEYQPLGPFLAKNFATTISPWVTPMAALEAFHSPAAPRPSADPKPLAYLQSAMDQQQGNLNVALEVFLTTKTMRDNKLDPFLVSKSNANDLYWTPAQLIAHHTSNGCNLQIGDVLATGTISGPTEASAGCLLELTRNGAQT